jgi:hypothetical protein
VQEDDDADADADDSDDDSEEEERPTTLKRSLPLTADDTAQRKKL